MNRQGLQSLILAITRQILLCCEARKTTFEVEFFRHNPQTTLIKLRHRRHVPFAVSVSQARTIRERLAARRQFAPRTKGELCHVGGGDQHLDYTFDVSSFEYERNLIGLLAHVLDLTLALIEEQFGSFKIVFLRAPGEPTIAELECGNYDDYEITLQDIRAYRQRHPEVN